MFEIAFGIAFFLLGVAFMGIPIVNSVRGFRARRWPILAAVVLDKAIKTEKARRGTRLVPTVRYQYQVDGCTYEGTRIMFGGISIGDQEYADRFMSYFEIGEPIPVYVSPTRPQVSVVMPDVVHNLWVLIIFGGLFAFTGANLVFGNLKMDR